MRLGALLGQLGHATHDTTQPHGGTQVACTASLHELPLFSISIPKPAFFIPRPCSPPLQLLRDVVALLRCITDREAVNIGIFLCETFRLLNHWRSSEKVGRAGGGHGRCM